MPYPLDTILPDTATAMKMKNEAEKTLQQMAYERELQRMVSTGMVAPGMMGSVVGQSVGGNAKPPYQPLEMLNMRMRLSRKIEHILPFISAYVGNQRVYVFAVNNSYEAVTIEDDPNLFPSDQLITQLRLLVG